MVKRPAQKSKQLYTYFLIALEILGFRKSHVTIFHFITSLEGNHEGRQGVIRSLRLSDALSLKTKFDGNTSIQRNAFVIDLFKVLLGLNFLGGSNPLNPKLLPPMLRSW